MFGNHKWNGKIIWAWLCIVVFLGSLVASGAVLKYKVNNNEKVIAEIRVKQDKDHDILIEIKTIVKGIEKTLNNK